jgi:hypothetical protein
MALMDRKVKTANSQAGKRKNDDQPFAEIDAKKFERAQRNPKIKKFVAAADRHIETLFAEGRID